MTGPRILFVVDAGPLVGGGHVMRSLTLAGALQARGAACVFLAPPPVATVLDAFAPALPRRAAASTALHDLAAAAAAESWDGVVFDHYGLAAAEHRAIAAGRPALVIDDLANRPLGGELVLDSGPARRAEDYNGLIADEARLMLGPRFAPVRPEFAALRESALARRGGPIGRILVSLGLTDLGGITARVVERLRPRIGDTALDIVLGGEAPSLPGLAKLARRDPRLQLHVDTAQMARLTAEADIGIGGAGSSAWERCTLGLPTLQLVLADNQRAAAAALEASEAALAVDAAAADFEARFDRGLMRLTIDAELRRRLAAASAQVCDGEGADRVASALLQKLPPAA
jgi:UDP-2,4-diacetamido-2,4,6-trideoxy-beta-L-altropyranose hydrolase